MKKFRISIDLDVVLDENAIWPDGDRPENPTAADVLKVLDQGDMGEILSSWNLEIDAEWVVVEVPDAELAKGP